MVFAARTEMFHTKFKINSASWEFLFQKYAFICSSLNHAPQFMTFKWSSDLPTKYNIIIFCTKKDTVWDHWLNISERIGIPQNKYNFKDGTFIPEYQGWSSETPTLCLFLIIYFYEQWNFKQFPAYVIQPHQIFFRMSAYCHCLFWILNISISQYCPQKRRNIFKIFRFLSLWVKNTFCWVMTQYNLV
jgi:hypothetical protein